MQTNNHGQIALKHMKGGQRLVYGTVFIPRANISLAWVDPENVPQLLAVKGGCCGGEKPVIFYANENDVRQWTNGGGR